MFLIKYYWVLQNARVTAFTVSELLRENQEGRDRGWVKLPHPIQIRVNSISISNNSSDFFLSSFKVFCSIILVQKGNEQFQVHIFQLSYFESFQEHQLPIIYRFKSTNRDIHLSFFFIQSFSKLSLHTCNLQR